MHMTYPIEARGLFLRSSDFAASYAADFLFGLPDFFLPVGFAPGRGMSAVGFTASSPRIASSVFNGILILSPWCGTLRWYASAGEHVREQRAKADGFMEDC